MNRLGKSLEVCNFHQEAQKCHLLDARISLARKDKPGFLVAVGNLILSLSMIDESEEQ